MGGTFHPKLNIDLRPIANKYREGKVKRTLKRELNQYLKSLRGKQIWNTQCGFCGCFVIYHEVLRKNSGVPVPVVFGLNICFQTDHLWLSAGIRT
jgi:hypothetical protein